MFAIIFDLVNRNKLTEILQNVANFDSQVSRTDFVCSFWTLLNSIQSFQFEQMLESHIYFNYENERRRSWIYLSTWGAFHLSVLIFMIYNIHRLTNEVCQWE